MFLYFLKRVNLFFKYFLIIFKIGYNTIRHIYLQKLSRFGLAKPLNVFFFILNALNEKNLMPGVKIQNYGRIQDGVNNSR
jgi:hypothetical protein